VIVKAMWQVSMGESFSNGIVAEHVPVMREEVLRLLQCRPGGIYVDGTVGLGGHAWAILEMIQPGGLLIGLDRDKESLEKARVHLQPFADSTRLLHENFKNLPLVLNNLGIQPIDGILIDLGVSSYQLLSPERGFSFQSEDLLDMRMDRSQRLTAADLVNTLPQEQLADIIYRFGEERHSRRIAAAIVSSREQARITRCAQLAQIVSRAFRGRGERIHPATRTFQALRIAVNQELERLDEFIINAVSYLRPGGRLAVISFHSLEDRIVKKAFRLLSGNCVCERPPALCTCPRQATARIVTSHPLTANDAELAINPRARSAKLRALERS
jgi:16S rRNA (cytosine1402-N4)-methyltransferase